MMIQCIYVGLDKKSKTEAFGRKFKAKETNTREKCSQKYTCKKRKIKGKIRKQEIK